MHEWEFGNRLPPRCPCFLHDQGIIKSVERNTRIRLFILSNLDFIQEFTIKFIQNDKFTKNYNIFCNTWEVPFFDILVQKFCKCFIFWYIILQNIWCFNICKKMTKSKNMKKHIFLHIFFNLCKVYWMKKHENWKTQLVSAIHGGTLFLQKSTPLYLRAKMYKKKDSKKDTFTKSKIPSVRHFSSHTASSAGT